MTKKLPTPKVKVEMGQRKSGLAVPTEAVDSCRHGDVFKRVRIVPNQYVCKDCDDRVLMVILQFAVMTAPEFEEFKKEQAKKLAAAQRKAKTGLVTPEDVRREQQEKK
jgi:hypothetical protein